MKERCREIKMLKEELELKFKEIISVGRFNNDVYDTSTNINLVEVGLLCLKTGHLLLMQ